LGSSSETSWSSRVAETSPQPDRQTGWVGINDDMLEFPHAVEAQVQDSSHIYGESRAGMAIAECLAKLPASCGQQTASAQSQFS
jgi:hypothetical protein